VAMPIWRKVVLTPEAMPERWGVTTPTAVEASGGLTIPDPAPATMKPGIRWVQELDPSSPVMSSRPTPTRRRPGPMSQRTGMWVLSRPAMVAVTRVTPLMTSRRRPVPRAE
jgi:hypothetical protein